jgi:hypothetical protein
MGGACSAHGEMINAYKICKGNLKGIDYTENLGVNCRITLKWIFG